MQQLEPQSKVSWRYEANALTELGIVCSLSSGRIVPIRTLHRFWRNFLVDGDPTGTATLGVSPFGLVEECIGGDLASIMNFEPTKAALINTDFEGVAKGSFAGANGHSR